MIKLIASDIDGTLLRSGARQISDELFAQVRRLRRQGILFCPASGRQYSSLLGLFAPIARESYFLCENGAALFGPGDPGPLLAKTDMDREAALTLAGEIDLLPGCDAVLSGANCSYIRSRDPELEDRLRFYAGNNVVRVDRYADIPETVIKVSAYCRPGTAEAVETLMPRWGRQFQGAISGRVWLDFTLADKGSGLLRLCRVLGIDPEEVMAFGDNDNDLPMLTAVGHPYLMEGAPAHLPPGLRLPTCPSVESVLAAL